MIYKISSSLILLNITVLTSLHLYSKLDHLNINLSYPTNSSCSKLSVEKIVVYGKPRVLQKKTPEFIVKLLLRVSIHSMINLNRSWFVQGCTNQSFLVDFFVSEEGATYELLSTNIHKILLHLLNIYLCPPLYLSSQYVNWLLTLIA